MIKKFQLTPQGLKALEEEYTELTKVKHPAAVERLSRARAMGDLSENSEYHAAKEEMAVSYGRIKELEELMRNVDIVEVTGSTHAVSIGSTVTVKTNGATDEFSIVGEFEADPMNKKLSASSPIGLALLGRKMNDEVKISTPAGEKIYVILSIK
jgi:transcription elongation factor GreA